MLGNHFDHNTFRKITGIFGTLFNEISLVRKHGAVVKDTIKVPLAYGPKQKFLARLEQQPDLAGNKVALQLPRMSFEITSILPDFTRMKNKNNFCLVPGTTEGTRSKVYNPVPYIVSYQLNIITKTETDVFEIIGQILPTFGPSFTVNFNPIDDQPTVKDKVKFTLTSVSPSDDYEGDFLSRRAIIYTLEFDAHVNLFGEIDAGGEVIKSATVNFKDFTDTDELYGTMNWDVNPSSANVDDTYTVDVTETWYDE